MPTATVTRVLNAQELNIPSGGDPFDFVDMTPSGDLAIIFNFVGNSFEAITFTEEVATLPGEADYDAELSLIMGLPIPHNTFELNSSVFGDIDDNGNSGVGNVGTEYVTIGVIPYDYTYVGFGVFPDGNGVDSTYLIIYIEDTNTFYALNLDNGADPANGNSGQSIGDLLGDFTYYFSDFICFTAGSMILTDQGERPVESLEVGDMVVSVDEGLVPLRWIGRKKLSRRDLKSNRKMWPVLIKANALGVGTPARDTMVSPQHRILLTSWQSDLLFEEQDILVPAKALINDHNIVTNYDVDEVEYIHLLFDTHQLVTVDNCVSESFFPYHTSMNTIEEAAKEEIFTLFPELREDKSSYGHAARLSLKPYEFRVLINR